MSLHHFLVEDSTACSSRCSVTPGPALTWNDLPRAQVSCYKECLIPAAAPGPPAQEVGVVDLTPLLMELGAASGVVEGAVTIVSRHTTTAVMINEWESRLVEDVSP